MVTVDKISQEALESIGIEDQNYEESRKAAEQNNWRGKNVKLIKTVRVEPGIQGRPVPVITGKVNNERLWWDSRSDMWVRKPKFQENL